MGYDIISSREQTTAKGENEVIVRCTGDGENCKGVLKEGWNNLSFLSEKCPRLHSAWWYMIKIKKPRNVEFPGLLDIDKIW